MSCILIVDDDLAICRTLQLHLSSQNHDVVLAHDALSGLSDLERHCPDLVIMDIRMPGLSGLDVLPEMRARAPDIPVLMITAFHDMDTTISAMKHGAIDYIHKPLDINEMDTAIKHALGKSNTGNGEVRIGNQEITQPGANIMVGRSSAMRDIFKTIGLVAPKAVTILISGESGTGKELVARAIHAASTNPQGPFVAVNCAAIVDTLLETDLFGHEKGAFTGASNRHIGKFALAQNGTIFLDEIGELSALVQAKLLRVLQGGEVRPVGSNKTIKVDVRIVAATNEDLRAMCDEGSFRQDLYFRLNVISIALPPLRERTGDVQHLVRFIMKSVAEEMAFEVSITPEAVEALARWRWPGNVRELENELRRSIALSGGKVTLEVLSDHVREA